MTTSGQIQRIAKESIRLDCPPRETPIWQNDPEFGRQHSAAIWDAISELRAGGVGGVDRVHADPRNQTSRYLAAQADSSDMDEDRCSCSCSSCRMDSCSGCSFSAVNCEDIEHCGGHSDEEDDSDDDDDDSDDDDDDDDDDDSDDDQKRRR